MDVSSHQPRDLTALIREHNIEHVIVRLYLPGEDPPLAHSDAQVQSARTNGCTVGVYVWCYKAFDPRATIQQAAAAAVRCGVDLGRTTLWLDCETYNPTGHRVEDPGPDAAWLRTAVDECAKLHVRPGIYTGDWWWTAYMDDTEEFGDILLWAAEHNRMRDLDSVGLFGGWQREVLWGHQYSANAIDLDVFRSEVA